MTDEQIIKALEQCKNVVMHDCKNCFYHKEYNGKCVVMLARDALDLINRKDAEIERLQAENTDLKKAIETMTNEHIKWGFEAKKRIENAKSEAYKEFENRALDEAKFYRVDKGYQGYLLWTDDVLKIKKELTKKLTEGETKP